MDPKTYYSTQYALTRGILKFQGVLDANGRIYEVSALGLRGALGKDIHLTLEDAQVDASSRWLKKAKNLAKQLQKAQAMANFPPSTLGYSVRP